jgi:hypothetical protein
MRMIILKNAIFVVLLSIAAVNGADLTEHSGVIEIRGDHAMLVTDSGEEYEIRGTDIGSLRQYHGMLVTISGTSIQPQEENSKQILYADRIVAESCGDAALWECLQERLRHE